MSEKQTGRQKVREGKRDKKKRENKGRKKLRDI